MMTSFDLTKPKPHLTTVFAEYRDGNAAPWQWCVSWNKSFNYTLTAANGNLVVGGSGLASVLKETSSQWLVDELKYYGVKISKADADATVHSFVLAVTGEMHPHIAVPAGFVRQPVDAPAAAPH